MKRILLSTALILSAAGAGSAMTSATELSPVDRSEVEGLVPTADLDNLTSAQANAISGILYGGDSNRSAQIRAILN
ncbi:MAG: hypothetical protein WA822_04815 [Albidovulum sp.]